MEPCHEGTSRITLPPPLRPAIFRYERYRSPWRREHILADDTRIPVCPVVCLPLGKRSASRSAAPQRIGGSIGRGQAFL
jgi:hypothetical protein